MNRSDCQLVKANSCFQQIPSKLAYQGSNTILGLEIALARRPNNDCQTVSWPFAMWAMWGIWAFRVPPAGISNLVANWKPGMPLQIQLFLSNISPIAGQSLLMRLLLLQKHAAPAAPPPFPSSIRRPICGWMHLGGFTFDPQGGGCQKLFSLVVLPASGPVPGWLAANGF